jgi:hypothetical protein
VGLGVGRTEAIGDGVAGDGVVSGRGVGVTPSGTGVRVAVGRGVGRGVDGGRVGRVVGEALRGCVGTNLGSGAGGGAGTSGAAPAFERPASRIGW